MSSPTPPPEAVGNVTDTASVLQPPMSPPSGDGWIANDVASIPAVETREFPSTSSGSSGRPSRFSLFPLKTGVRSWKFKDDELRKLLKLPDYLTLAMSAAIDSAGVSMGVVSRPSEVHLPTFPLLVFFNSKSGGRLGPALQGLLAEYIGTNQVFDLAQHQPSDVLRYGLGCLDKLGDDGDEWARIVRKRIRLMVAGGDGTVGWVLASVAELQLESDTCVPPVGVIPLGTGNDLSRSFGWGAVFGSARRSAVKRWLYKSTTALTSYLDSWQVVVKAGSKTGASHLKLPHAMHPQQHVPLPVQGNGESDVPEESASFEGCFWNYFSIGMDAQVAYGFHHLREEKPWIAAGRVTNQAIYSGYSCGQGWFFTACSSHPRARGLKKVVRLLTQSTTDEWQEVHIPPSVRAVVVLNLQSYAGGRHPWGYPKRSTLLKKGFMEAKVDDGLLEVVGLRDGWHAALVMVNMLTAVRLAQVRSLRLELRGGNRPRAYMQIDGEPWQQPLSQSDEPTIVEISRVSQPSLMLRSG